MRIVLQRIASAAAEVDGEVVARVGFGLLLFVAVVRGDGQEQIKRAAKKVAELRVFDDEKGRMQFDCFEAGATDYMTKEFATTGLRSRVRGWLMRTAYPVDRRRDSRRLGRGRRTDDLGRRTDDRGR